jgi:hypothetical protein
MATNRFEAFCARCRLTVQAGGGDVRRVEGRWVVRHTWCVDLDRAGELSGQALKDGIRDELTQR